MAKEPSCLVASSVLLAHSKLSRGIILFDRALASLAKTLPTHAYTLSTPQLGMASSVDASHMDFAVNATGLNDALSKFILSEDTHAAMLRLVRFEPLKLVLSVNQSICMPLTV